MGGAPKKKGHFSAELRAEAMHRLDGGASVASVARDLHIPRAALYRWRATAKKTALTEAAMSGLVRHPTKKGVWIKPGVVNSPAINGVPYPEATLISSSAFADGLAAGLAVRSLQEATSAFIASIDRAPVSPADIEGYLTSATKALATLASKMKVGGVIPDSGA